MIIKRIIIKHFKIIDFFDETIEKHTAIIGNHASGKTTIMHAIYWCINGGSLKSYSSERGRIEYDSYVSLEVEYKECVYKIERTNNEENKTFLIINGISYQEHKDRQLDELIKLLKIQIDFYDFEFLNGIIKKCEVQVKQLPKEVKERIAKKINEYSMLSRCYKGGEIVKVIDENLLIDSKVMGYRSEADMNYIYTLYAILSIEEIVSIYESPFLFIDPLFSWLNEEDAHNILSILRNMQCLVTSHIKHDYFANEGYKIIKL